MCHFPMAVPTPVVIAVLSLLKYVEGPKPEEK